MRRFTFNSVFLIVFLGIIAFGAHLLFASQSKVHTPTEVVHAAIDDVIDVLKRYPCKKGGDDVNATMCEHQKAKLHEIAGDFIDFDQVGKLAVGRYRRKFSKEEWDAFKCLFRELLEATYMKRIQDYSGEKIIFEAERILGSKKAQVDTKVITTSKSIPVSYRLVKVDENWKVYDILVEGVSLLKNYRQQFSSILRSRKPKALNAILRKKVSELHAN